MATPVSKTAVKPTEILASAGILVLACLGVLYFESSYLSDAWKAVQTARTANAKTTKENGALAEDLKDIGRAEKGIKDAFNFLNDGTIRPVAAKSASSIPSLADDSALRRPRSGATNGPVFNVPTSVKESLPLQLSNLDSAGMVIIPQQVGTGEKTRIFDAFSDQLELNRFVPLIWGMEEAYPLMQVEEVRAALPQGAPAFAQTATPLDIRVRLRFPLAETAKSNAKAKPGTSATGKGS